MVYLDNAATTYPKPAAVYSEVNRCMKMYGANPGRSGHRMSLNAAQQVYRSRELAAVFYNIEDVENIAFTQNCTYALNTVINGFLKHGDHVVISDMEHNSVLRPLSRMASRGVTFTVAKAVHGDFDATVDNFRNAINEKTKLFIINHASNVTGTILPLSRLTALAHQYDIKVLADTSQSSGVIPTDVQEMQLDFMASAGHKGLMGIMGTGILYVQNPELIVPLVCGGTGSSSLELIQPYTMPDKLESGTCNLPGICSLRAGIEFLQSKGTENIYRHEFYLLKALYDGLKNIPNVKLYTPEPQPFYNVPLLSFNIGDMQSEDTAEILDKKYSVAVRAGIHCAPLAHKALGTEQQGTVRISLSYFNNIGHINHVIKAVRSISSSV